MGKDNGHFHKYARTDIGVNKSYVVYQCRDNCSHYLTKTLVLGRRARCWNCNSIFEVKPEHLKKVKLVCCTRKKATEVTKDIFTEAMKELNFDA